MSEPSLEELVPRRVKHKDAAPASSDVVLDGYANLIRSIHEANEYLPESLRFHVPYGVQEALVAYIEERQAIESLTGEA